MEVDDWSRFVTSALAHGDNNNAWWTRHLQLGFRSFFLLVFLFVQPQTIFIQILLTSDYASFQVWGVCWFGFGLDLKSINGKNKSN